MLYFRHASRRNTKCYQINLGGDTFYISYETIIAASVGDQRIRLDNSWGPTTGRHMNDMGVRSYKVVSRDELQDLIRQSVLRAGQHLAMHKLKGTT